MARRGARQISDAIKSVETIPETLPGALPQPTQDEAWSEQERRRGRLRGEERKLAFAPRHSRALEMLNAGVTKTGQAAPNNASSHQRVDERAISEDEYRQVYEAYAKTGRTREISRSTGIREAHVRHIIYHGIPRLGLPPVHAHAVDEGEVHRRLADNMQAISSEKDEQFLANLPDLSAAITSRVARECAASQATLEATIRTADVCLGYVQRMMQKIEEDGYAMPDVVTGSTLKTLTEVMSNLTRAVDTAVRASRISGGEPESTVSVTVTHLVSQMSPDERREFIRTRRLPASLRIVGGHGLAAIRQEGGEEKPSRGTVIDVTPAEEPAEEPTDA